jgi:endonuclease YncB( thermonuclease family)
LLFKQLGKPMLRLRLLPVLMLCLVTLACAYGYTPTTPQPGGGGVVANPPTVPPQTGVVGDSAQVTRIIDGDTIDVDMNGVGYRVRYVGVNTPERDETCYQEATDANAALVQNQIVTLVRDVNNTDRYGRLLRYVYVGTTFVNAQLVAQGWAEAAEYPPDIGYTAYFRDLEVQAQNANLGCHPTGIFDDGSLTR